MILSLLTSGPDWHAVAGVFCRLAKRAPLEPMAEPSGAGSGTKPSVSGQCIGEAFQVPESYFCTELLHPTKVHRPWIPCSRPRDASLANPDPVVWLVAILECDALGFLYFCIGEGRGSSTILSSRELFCLLCHQLPHASVNRTADLVKASSPSTTPSALRWSPEDSFTHMRCGSNPDIGDPHQETQPLVCWQEKHNLPYPEAAMSGRIRETLCRRFCILGHS